MGERNPSVVAIPALTTRDYGGAGRLASEWRTRSGDSEAPGK